MEATHHLKIYKKGQEQVQHEQPPYQSAEYHMFINVTNDVDPRKANIAPGNMQPYDLSSIKHLNVDEFIREHPVDSAIYKYGHTATHLTHPNNRLDRSRLRTSQELRDFDIRMYTPHTKPHWTRDNTRLIVATSCSDNDYNGKLAILNQEDKKVYLYTICKIGCYGYMKSKEMEKKRSMFMKTLHPEYVIHRSKMIAPLLFWDTLIKTTRMYSANGYQIGVGDQEEEEEVKVEESFDIEDIINRRIREAETKGEIIEVSDNDEDDSNEDYNDEDVEDVYDNDEDDKPIVHSLLEMKSIIQRELGLESNLDYKETLKQACQELGIEYKVEVGLKCQYNSIIKEFLV